MAALVTQSRALDALLTTTLDNYRPTLEDNVFSARPLLYWLKQKDRIWKKGGGAQIIVPLLYGQNTTVQSYVNGETLNGGHTDGISAAIYDWKQLAASIEIYGIEEAKNSGEQELIDLVQAKIDQTEESVAESLNAMAYLGDGSTAYGGGSAGSGWNGLANMVTGTTGTFGQINRATGGNEFWRSYVDSTSAVLTLSQMTTCYNTVSRGSDSPDAIFTTQALYEKYESLLQPQLRFQDPKTADGGFQNLLFKTAPIMFDPVMTTAYALGTTGQNAVDQDGTMYFLNSKYVKLAVLADKWFSPTPFVKPALNDYRVAQVLCYGNFVSSNCQRLGKLTGKTA